MREEADVKSLFPHSATTRDVTVRVSVSFLPEQSEPAKGRWSVPSALMSQISPQAWHVLRQSSKAMR